jgi:deoxyribodipyrimidine photo-lyase
MKARLRQSGLGAESFEGHLLHEPSRLLTGHGGPYRVYGAFRRTLANGPDPRDPVDAPKNMAWLIEAPGEKLPASHPLRAAPDWAKAFASEWRPGENGAHARLESLINEKLNSYNEGRDFMAQDFTSKLSPHLAHGEITPYQILSRVRTVHSVGQTAGAAKLRAELIWREFCHHLKFHHADLHEKNYDSRFNNFPWRSDDDQLRSWRKGLTGYPIVDAGMRQLWQTGWMHNRVRMIVASFLTKHLLIDWREGERWFWNTLVDADCASNPANWQWVAGSGADAAPYFRIFNPVLQGQKFDPDGEYVRRFVPELARLGGRAIHAPWTAPTADLAAAGVTLGHNYPFPIVDHSMARSRALAAFAAIKGAL